MSAVSLHGVAEEMELGRPAQFHLLFSQVRVR